MTAKWKKRNIVERLKNKYNWYYGNKDLTKGQRKMIEQKTRWEQK